MAHERAKQSQMVGRLVSWWRKSPEPTWKWLSKLSQLELKDGEFVTRGGTGQPTAYPSAGSTAPDLSVRVRIEHS